MHRPRVLVVVILVAVLAVLAVSVGVVLTSKVSARRTACTPSSGPIASGTAAESSPLVLPARPRVLIFGDSYTEGQGAQPLTQGYAYQVGPMLNWDVTVFGVGGTGYLAPGPRDEGTYEARLAKAPPGPFDLVVVQGSTNDARQPISGLSAAVTRTIQAVRTTYAPAQILMLGPIDLHGTSSKPMTQVNVVVRDSARALGVSYIDAMGEQWFQHDTSKPYINPSNGHPNNQGHALIASNFLVDVGRRLSAGTSECR